MKASDPKLWLGVLSLAFVLALFLLDTERATPGPLTTAHARQDELGGTRGCEACHGELGTPMAEACADCHAEIGAQLASGSGLHGRLAADLASDCARCHLEHHGDEAALVDARAFALAGVPDRELFDHAHVAFALGGRHDELACSKCHVHADAEFLEKGQRRFLGLEQGCTPCHADPHEGRFEKGCEACHDQEHPFGELGSFVHTDRLPLAGAHAGLECAKCHAEGSDYAVEAVGGRSPPPARACEDCHESPHRADFVAGAAALARAESHASCAACHASEPGGFETSTMGADLHAASGVDLARPHESVRCEQCHAPRASEPEFARRYPGRAPDDCAACHADPHAGQFVGPTGALQRCLDCHLRDAFAPPTFDVAAHGLTAFPLEGAHLRTECAQCHEKPAELPRRFEGTPAACEACHADAHAGKLTASAGTACAACHSTASFAEVAPERFDHALATTFTLRGSHAQVECEACHPLASERDERGRAFGFATDPLAGPRGECSGCHADLHGGAFDAPGRARELGGRTGCARCHAEESFRVLTSVFDHGTWTGYPLEGAHFDAECASCHGENPRPAERRLGRVRERSAGPLERCDTCHEDAHAGLFARVDPSADCARCHTVQSFADFAREEFDHARWTGYALDGAHARAACEACHVPSADATARRFGRASGTDCASCHADPHAGQFARASGGGRDEGCARCHAGAASFTDLAFDHARDSRFALDPTHAKLACDACHKPWPLPNGGRAVRYVPLGTQCVDCHGFAPRAGGGR